MPTEKDIQIFCCGVINNAVQSGQCNLAGIQDWLDHAKQAFINTFGKVEDAPAPQLPYSPPSGPERMVPMPMPSLPEGKPFEIWRKDQCGHWNKSMREATWEWLLETAKKPDGLQAMTALKELAASDPGDTSGKYYKSNLKRVERAKAVLLMVSKP